MFFTIMKEKVIKKSVYIVFMHSQVKNEYLPQGDMWLLNIYSCIYYEVWIKLMDINRYEKTRIVSEIWH